MVAGQMQDVALVGYQTDLQSLQTMHSRKTGALIRASVLMGAATASRIDLMHLQALDQFSTNIGMAFQIRDDIIDCVSSTETLGKTSGSDAAADKPNYVSLLGLDGAQQQLQQHYQIARDSLDVFGDRCVTLRSLAEFIVQRMH
jgi:geranylgeranyl pyrophosphate synthase